MRELGVFVDEELDLWQSFLLSLWVFALFLRKFVDAASELLERWFLDSLTENESRSSGVSPGRDRDFDAPVDAVSVEVPSLSGSGDALGVDNALIPSLPDSVVRDAIWPLLVNPPTISLLQRLSQVSLP